MVYYDDGSSTEESSGSAGRQGATKPLTLNVNIATLTDSIVTSGRSSYETTTGSGSSRRYYYDNAYARGGSKRYISDDYTYENSNGSNGSTGSTSLVITEYGGSASSSIYLPGIPFHFKANSVSLTNSMIGTGHKHSAGLKSADSMYFGVLNSNLNIDTLSSDPNVVKQSIVIGNPNGKTVSGTGSVGTFESKSGALNLQGAITFTNQAKLSTPTFAGNHEFRAGVVVTGNSTFNAVTTKFGGSSTFNGNVNVLAGHVFAPYPNYQVFSMRVNGNLDLRGSASYTNFSVRDDTIVRSNFSPSSSCTVNGMAFLTARPVAAPNVMGFIEVDLKNFGTSGSMQFLIGKKKESESVYSYNSSPFTRTLTANTAPWVDNDTESKVDFRYVVAYKAGSPPANTGWIKNEKYPSDIARSEGGLGLDMAEAKKAAEEAKALAARAEQEAKNAATAGAKAEAEAKLSTARAELARVQAELAKLEAIKAQTKIDDLGEELNTAIDNINNSLENSLKSITRNMSSATAITNVVSANRLTSGIQKRIELIVDFDSNFELHIVNPDSSSYNWSVDTINGLIVLSDVRSVPDVITIRAVHKEDETLFQTRRLVRSQYWFEAADID